MNISLNLTCFNGHTDLMVFIKELLSFRTMLHWYKIHHSMFEIDVISYMPKFTVRDLISITDGKTFIVEKLF